MPKNQYKVGTDNDPNIIVTLEAHSSRACTFWADPHNESFYIAPICQATSVSPQKVVEGRNNAIRAVTPDPKDPGRVKPREPALQLTFSEKPKKPELGYVLGSDRETCDIYLGTLDDCVSPQMFAISFNQNNEVIMKSRSSHATAVTYSAQTEERAVFTWIFPSDQDISVNIAETIIFSVIVPTHGTDKAAFKDHCRDFRTLADSASGALNPPNFTKQQNTMEPPVYLRTGLIGSGGFGVVYKALSMPDGRTVAVKRFKSIKSIQSKIAWKLEADVLKKLAKTPHNHIVEFIDAGLGDKPYLVMGLASGGNLEGQKENRPFTFGEIVLVLRQMLEALVYLHIDCQMTHRDIKPANILCDSRAHFRLADFGLAKEGDNLKTPNGTKPYMAPEMFVNKPYTTAVDLWALGMVITWLSSISWPPGYKGDEGRKWCAAVVANFQRYEKQCARARGSNALEQMALNFLVGQHMLRMKPEERESAVGCMDRGEFLWYLLAQAGNSAGMALTSEDTAESFPDILHADHTEAHLQVGGPTVWTREEKELGSWEKVAPSRENDILIDRDSEADTEILRERTLKPGEWLSLEREFPVDEAAVLGSVPQQFAKARTSRQQRKSRSLRLATPKMPTRGRKSVRETRKSDARRAAALAA